MSSQFVKEGAGFCGKVPVLGDFLHEGLAIEFNDCWNEWMRAALAVSKEQLGTQWLDYYLTSPVWHFALSEGSCGPEAMIGTMIPSIDKVGRHYPLIMAKPAVQNPITCRSQPQWCQEFEDFILRTLDDDFSIQSWRTELQQFTFSLPNSQVPAGHLGHAEQKVQNWLLHGALTMDNNALLHSLLRQQFGQYCLWWTEGSEHIDAVCLISKGLPLISQYASMLDGQWDERGWLLKPLHAAREQEQ
ncbi:type VI secretion system-associated protein TagF [Alkalimonas collagenimarina]|uniref:Type VI secretion system-associated protein TagF n=1 Tax=Alkalimonas collagenimarina TaxID=400390 RepID=A0ABT9H2X7_9GAMM|nr:type VI secretion system-associated protein TagF [Alkalimonas collagenimarina]MDP4537672.1 type VI secretion system-associated protein TagF [Alkalimonas collagenimarina]